MDCYIPGFFQRLCADRLARLPAEVMEDEPIRVALVDKAAALLDDSSLSIDFRMESKAALDELLGALEVEAQQHLGGQ